jgi:hypothetical protein
LYFTPNLFSVLTGEYLLVCALETPELGAGIVGHYGTRNFELVAAPPAPASPPPPPPSGPYGFVFISTLTPNPVRA